MMKSTHVINANVSDFDSIAVYCEGAKNGSDHCTVTARTHPANKGLLITLVEADEACGIFLSTTTAIKFAEALIKLANKVDGNSG